MRVDPGSESTHLRFEAIHDAPGRARLEELLQSAFPVKKGGSFFDDFPVWDSRGVMQIAGYAGDRLVTSAAARTTYIKAPRRTFKIALIGAVATHADYRGQGLASSAVARAIDWAISQGAALIALWGSEHSLYRKLGFELAGAQFRTPLADLRLPAPREAAAVGKGWIPTLFPLLQKREGGCVLQASDEEWLSRHKNVEWFWLGSPKAPRAYAALGRGIDLEGIVHEWGGDEEASKELLGWMARARPETSIIGSARALQSLGLVSDSTTGEYLALLRVVNASAILGAYGIDGDLQGPPGQLAQTLFGPDSPRDPSLLEGSLPLPLWIWGLDAC